MKAVALCVCILSVASFSSAHYSAANPPRTTEEMFLRIVAPLIRTSHICMIENNMTPDEAFNMMDIVNGTHEQPENEARRKRYGCILDCAMRKKGLMNGTQIKEVNVQLEINSRIILRHPLARWTRQITKNCTKDARNITDVCDKMFSVYECLMIKVYDQLYSEPERIYPEQVFQVNGTTVFLPPGFKSRKYDQYNQTRYNQPDIATQDAEDEIPKVGSSEEQTTEHTP